MTGPNLFRAISSSKVHVGTLWKEANTLTDDMFVEYGTVLKDSAISTEACSTVTFKDLRD